jgi:hypothetical protein
MAYQLPRVSSRSHVNTERSKNVVNELCKGPSFKPKNEDRVIDGEVTGYDEVSLIHMDLHENEYQPLDVQYLDTESGIVCITLATTPLGFRCYVVSLSEHHSKATLESINPFMSDRQLDNILLKCGHKASGVAIRFRDKVCFKWEDNIYNFSSKIEHELEEEIIPIITASQLQQYPEESLLAMQDQYRSIRSDQVSETDLSMQVMSTIIEELNSKYSDLHDKAYEALLSLKDSIDPLSRSKLSEERNKKLVHLNNYRERIINRLVSISRKERYLEELLYEYKLLSELVNPLI